MMKAKVKTSKQPIDEAVAKKILVALTKKGEIILNVDSEVKRFADMKAMQQAMRGWRLSFLKKIFVALKGDARLNLQEEELVNAISQQVIKNAPIAKSELKPHEKISIEVDAKSGRVVMREGKEELAYENLETFRVGLSLHCERDELERIFLDLELTGNADLAKKDKAYLVQRIYSHVMSSRPANLDRKSVHPPAPALMKLGDGEWEVLEAMVSESKKNKFVFGFINNLNLPKRDRKQLKLVIDVLAGKKIILVEHIAARREGTKQVEATWKFTFSAPVQRALSEGQGLERYFERVVVGKRDKTLKVKSVKHSNHAMGIAAYWAKLFFDNEINSKAGKPEAIRIDEEISAALKTRYPGRESKIFDQVTQVRGRYNRGILTGSNPENRSFRYVRDKSGKVSLVAPRNWKVTTAGK